LAVQFTHSLSRMSIPVSWDRTIRVTSHDAYGDTRVSGVSNFATNQRCSAVFCTPELIPSVPWSGLRGSGTSGSPITKFILILPFQKLIEAVL
jgi:hypothetical protein